METEKEMDTTEKEMEATPINEEVAASRTNMQLSMENPIHAYQRIVARCKPDYIVTLHELLGTFAKHASQMKK